MNKVTVDVEQRTITAGGGSLWGTIDEEAAKHRLATVGGTVNHTGAGTAMSYFLSVCLLKLTSLSQALAASRLEVAMDG
jgi:hypothetical protein